MPLISIHNDLVTPQQQQQQQQQQHVGFPVSDEVPTFNLLDQQRPLTGIHDPSSSGHHDLVLGHRDLVLGHESEYGPFFDPSCGATAQDLALGTLVRSMSQKNLMESYSSQSSHARREENSDTHSQDLLTANRQYSHNHSMQHLYSEDRLQTSHHQHAPSVTHAAGSQSSPGSHRRRRHSHKSMNDSHQTSHHSDSRNFDRGSRSQYYTNPSDFHNQTSGDECLSESHYSPSPRMHRSRMDPRSSPDGHSESNYHNHSYHTKDHSYHTKDHSYHTKDHSYHTKDSLSHSLTRRRSHSSQESHYDNSHPSPQYHRRHPHDSSKYSSRHHSPRSHRNAASNLLHVDAPVVDGRPVHDHHSHPQHSDDPNYGEVEQCVDALEYLNIS